MREHTQGKDHISVCSVARHSLPAISVKYMNVSTRGKNHSPVSIVVNSLWQVHIWVSMLNHTQERTHLNAALAQRPSNERSTAQCMKESTQVNDHFHVAFVANALSLLLSEDYMSNYTLGKTFNTLVRCTKKSGTISLYTKMVFHAKMGQKYCDIFYCLFVWSYMTRNTRNN